MAEAHKRFCVDAHGPAFKKYIVSALEEWEEKSEEPSCRVGVLDSIKGPGLVQLLGDARRVGPVHIEALPVTDLAVSFDIMGTTRPYMLPPPRAPVPSAQDRAVARARAEADASERARVKEERRREKQAFIQRAMNEIEEATCVTLLQKILSLLLDHLVKRKWEAWPFNDGNPFTVKFTRANCTGLGVPDYFKVIVNPMDLTRMGEALQRKKPHYKTFDAFSADLQLIVSNACTYNAPGSEVYLMAQELKEDYEKRLLPYAMGEFEKLKQKEAKARWKRLNKDQMMQLLLMHGRT